MTTTRKRERVAKRKGLCARADLGETKGCSVATSITSSVLTDQNETKKNRLFFFFPKTNSSQLIFTWDGVITDTKELQRQAWKQLAEEEGFKWPEIERPFIYEGSPERAITEMLHWTRDFAYARRMGFRLNELFSEQFEDISQPLPGIKQWLERVNQIGIPIAVVSNMSRESTSNALDRMELGQMFDALVTAEDDMDTCASQLLSASIKVARPPKKCVAFTSSPVMVTAAHNCTMKAVAVLGAYPAYELKEADLTCSNLEELSIYNVRRLFAMDGDNFMDLKKEQEASAAPMKESPAGVSDY